MNNMFDRRVGYYKTPPCELILNEICEPHPPDYYAFSSHTRQRKASAGGKHLETGNKTKLNTNSHEVKHKCYYIVTNLSKAIEYQYNMIPVQGTSKNNYPYLIG